jgi:nitroreductase
MIDRAIEVAAQSPSACNRQPFEFRVIDDPELVRAVSVIPMGTAGYADNIPVFVVLVGQQRNYFDERDRHLIYIDGSLAAMGFVYALEAQGLSSCCINWPDVEDRERKMAALLKLEADERPVMCLAVGHPDPAGLVAYSQKKPVDQLRRYNFE